VYFRIYINGGTPSADEATALAVASIILATISYRYVERPFRRRRWSAPRTVSIGLASVITIFCASMYIDSADGLPQRVPAEGQAMRSLEVMWDWPCKESAIEGIPGLYCVFGAPWHTAKRKTMIWGDSHAEHFAPIIDAINADRERSFLVFAGCPPVLGGEFFIVVPGAPRYIDRCNRYYSNGVKLLKEDTSITQVIFTSNWYELPWRIQGNSLHELPAMSSALTKLITETSAPGRRFLLVGMVPRLPAEIVECAIRDSSKLLRRPCVSVVQGSDALAVKKISAPTDGLLIEVANALPNVSAIIPTEKLCRNDACDVYLDGEFLYRDMGHIRRNLHLQTKEDFADKIGLTAALADDRQGAAVRPDLAGDKAR
jgi:hypothetical protein